MQRFFQKFIVYFLAPAITLILGFLKVPDWALSLRENHLYLANFLDYFALIGTAFIYYFSILSPYRLYEKLRDRKWDVLKQLMDRIDEDYDKQFEFKANVMLPKRIFLFKIEPERERSEKTKFSFTGKVFQVAWRYGKDGISPKLRITVNQGVCGWAFREAKGSDITDIKGAELASELQYEFNFSSKQYALTDGIVIVVSCPLTVTKVVDSIEKQKVVGVLNIESKISGSSALLTDEDLKLKFYDKVSKAAKIYNKLHV